MTYNFQERLAHNARRMKETNHETVQYERPGSAPVPVVVTPIKQAADELGSSGNIIRTEVQLWGIDVADLGALFPPLEKDKIIRTTGEEYRVLKGEDKKTVWRYTTSAQTRILVESIRSKSV